MINGKKVAAVVVAYKAEKTIEKTIRGIPAGSADMIIVVDDASGDKTSEIAEKLGATTIIHPKNRGYGGAQKTGYRKALDLGADIVVMLHGDFQYDPTLLPEMARPIAEGRADACFGSRMQSKKAAWKAGMPWWRFVANVSLSKIENAIFQLGLSEYHTGYRAYSKETLSRIPFEQNSDDFVFDSEIFAELSLGKFRAAEIPIPTRYFKEALSINFRRSVVYGLSTLAVMYKFSVHKMGLKHYPHFTIRK